MFRNCVFVFMVNPSPPADVIMGGQGRKIGTRERRERRGGGALVCGGEIRRFRLVHPLRKIKGAKMGRKKERLFRIKRASMQSEMGKMLLGQCRFPLKREDLVKNKKSCAFCITCCGRKRARGPICMCQGQSASLCIFPPESRQPYPAFLFFLFCRGGGGQKHFLQTKASASLSHFPLPLFSLSGKVEKVIFSSKCREKLGNFY